ncbi:MAG: regulatory protein RecX [Nitriliruptorales bacterium]|nr:regulatory protein RecX [Nitriliruptorales bacterium]
MTASSRVGVGIDAEEWLRERGVTHDELTGSPEQRSRVPARAARTDISLREAMRLASEAPTAAAVDPVADAVEESLADEVARAMAYVRRATASTPMSEGRLRQRLAARDFSRPAIDRALDQARAQRHVDDEALARALAREGIAKGHAPSRVRRDLLKRDLAAGVIDDALDEAAPTDLEAAAFDLAQRKARSSRDAPPEAAFRRVVGHLARRGYSADLARRVARQVIFEDREPDRIAGH